MLARYQFLNNDDKIDIYVCYRKIEKLSKISDEIGTIDGTSSNVSSTTNVLWLNSIRRIVSPQIITSENSQKNTDENFSLAIIMCMKKIQEKM